MKTRDVKQLADEYSDLWCKSSECSDFSNGRAVWPDIEEAFIAGWNAALSGEGEFIKACETVLNYLEMRKNQNF
jgi:hypothetical protein